ncbi:WD40/YVTN/BNR-like repeat-containing protein [Acanthopleuribacter pedis]|uniref:Glycosyl hydrolase n=1 Tax=Acanthopleuribacter pedis TaxID=442870 RepID=A0A8J7QAL9_9BACT|nr:hypothetical protein [Acanthopleuribacter pedis]MBO1320134.1 hypothetical protein [Acanthopleuribacter pedis]
MKRTMLSLTVMCLVSVCAFIGIKDINQPTDSTLNLPLSLKDPTKPSQGSAFKNLPKEEQRRRNTIERQRWEFDFLKDPSTGLIPPDAASIRAQVLNDNPRAKNAPKRLESLVPRGPGNLGGRTRALAFDRSDATGQTMLAGGVSSGLFRSENRGQSWTKVSAQDEMHNVTAIAQDPRNPNVWYYGTGELSGNSASDAGATYYGDGIWRSEDGGRTWSQIEATRGNSVESRDNVYDYVSELVVHPVTSDLYISSPQGIYRLRQDTGALEFVLSSSLPNYASWDMHDIEINPDGSEIFVVISQQAGRNAGIFRSTTGDFSSWERLAGGTFPLPTGWPRDTRRAVIALDTANRQLYALMVNGHFNDCEEAEVKSEAVLLRLDLAGNSWTDLTANMPNDGDCLSGNNPFAAQGGYDLTLNIAPNNPSRIYVGGTNLYVSDDAFTTNTQTRRIGGYAAADTYRSYEGHHPDIHAVVFDPTNPDIIVSGSDGGLHAALVGDGTVVWENLNNDYFTYQYYHVALSPQMGDVTALGGAQDNGTTAAIGGTQHIEFAGGDGVAVGFGDYRIVDGEQLPVLYYGFQRGPIRRFNGENFESIRPTEAEDSIFVTYFHLDPDNTQHLYYAARHRLFATDQALTVDPDGWFERTSLSEAIGEGADIRAMATTRGPYGAENHLFVGTNDGRLFRLSDPANPENPGTLLAMTLPVSGGLISSIAVHPGDDSKVVVTVSNYKTPSVFYSDDATGDNPTWTLVEGNIEQLSFRSSAIVQEPERTIYLVGTNAGLWSTETLDGANTVWQREGLDTVGSAVVSQLALRPSDNNLIIGTHGNGMFQATFAGNGAVSSTQPNRYHLADIRTSDGADTYVGIVNSAEAETQVEIFAFDSAGQPLGRSGVLLSLTAKASTFRSVTNLFPTTAERIAWLQIGADAELSVFAEIRDASTRAAYLASSADQRVYLPHIARDTTNFETVLNVVNPEQAETAITLNGFPGDQTATIDRASGAFGFSSQPITDHLGSELQPGQWAELTAPGTGIAAMESFTRLPNRTQTAALGLNQTAGNTLNFLHVATDTNQFWTGMVYINLGDVATDVTETYYNAAGEVLKTGERNLTAKEKITLLFDFENQEEVPAGTAWVQVVATQPLIGYALFGAPSISNNDYFTGLQGNYGGGQRWLYPYFNSSAETFTGVVAVNLGDQPANLTFHAYDAAGNRLESRTIEAVSAKTKYVTTLAGLFQNAETLANGAWVEAVADGSEWAGFVLWGDQGVPARQHLAGIQATPLP